MLIFTNLSLFRLIKHTEKLLEEKEEKLCVKVLRTLREMMAIDLEYGEKVLLGHYIITKYNRQYLLL